MFEIEAEEGATLVFTAIGFATQEQAVGSGSTYDVVLQESKRELSEVVVTALGQRKEKRALGYSVSEVKGADLAVTNEVNPINALQGKAPVSISTRAPAGCSGTRASCCAVTPPLAPITSPSSS